MQPVGRGPALSDLLQMLTAIFNGSMNRQFANQSLGASTVPDMKTVWVMTRAARVMAAVGASIPERLRSPASSALGSTNHRPASACMHSPSSLATIRPGRGKRPV